MKTEIGNDCGDKVIVHHGNGKQSQISVDTPRNSIWFYTIASAEAVHKMLGEAIEFAKKMDGK